MSETILIAGASARCAVDSAIRGGYAPLAADLFNDVDLRRQCKTYRIKDYPDQLVQISQQLPPLCWMYTGGLENHPQVVDQVSRRHHLLGNPGSVLRQACDPMLIQEILADHDLHYPLTQVKYPEDSSACWLRKSLPSTGGKGVHWADQASQQAITPATSLSSRNIYYQRFIVGNSYSAVFVANQQTCLLIGVTRQIVGKRFTSGSLFGYSGSIGPVDLTSEHQSTLCRIGNALTSALNLHGLFGIDFIYQDDLIWTIEINPRLPASIEILESALGISVVDFHCRACRVNALPPVPPLQTPLRYGKAIIYARRPCTITTQCGHTWSERAAHRYTPTDNTDWWLADIPAIGTAVSAGSPILSVMAQGNHSRQVHRQLIHTVKQVRRQCNA